MARAVAHLTIFSHIALHFKNLVSLDMLTRCSVVCESAWVFLLPRSGNGLEMLVIRIRDAFVLVDKHTLSFLVFNSNG